MCLETGHAVRARLPAGAILAAVLFLAACRPPGYGRQDIDASVDSQVVGDGQAATDAGTDAAATCMHGFRLDGHGTAQSVWLTGDFVAWGGDPSHGAVPFTLGIDGGWTLTHAFPA